VIENIELPPRGSVRTRVPEARALSQVSPAVRALFRELERRGWELDHGSLQTRLIYRGHGVGGVNRGDEHAYISKLLARGALARRLRELGFEARKMDTRGEAYTDHRWHQIDLVHLDAFAAALREIQALIDRMKDSPTGSRS
jgi:GNAT superfamily N-acetyltransferase